MDPLLLIAALIAGFLTILAPCILPLLPVAIGGSLSSDKETRRNPYLIIGSLAVSVIAFTLIIHRFLIHIPRETWGYVAGTLVLIVGISFLFPRLWLKVPFVSKVSLLSNKTLGAGFKRKGALGDVMIGASLGPVFTSCSPTYFLILALLPENFLEGLIYLVAYTVGFSTILLFIVLVGEKVMTKLNVLASSEGKFKKVVGILIIASAIALYTGLDKDINTWLLDRGLYIDTTNIEQNLIEDRM